MKKSFFLGGLLAFFVILLINIPFKKENKVENKPFEWQENVIIKIDEDGVKHKTITDEEIIELDIEEKGTLKSYNASQSIFVFLRNEDIKFKLDVYIGKKLLTTLNLSGDLEDVKISPMGDYIIFKSKNYNYEIFDVKNNKRDQLKEDILPSGNMIKFLEDGRLVTYGTREEDKKNAIFIYNPEEREYHLIREINGVVKYMDVLRDYEILVLKTNSKGTKKLIKVNIESKKIEELTDEIKIIDKGRYLDNKYYFLGRKKNSEESIYSYDLGNKRLNRLTFNFPKNINIKAGIEIINREIYFEGYDEDLAKGNIYKVNPKDSSVSIVEGTEGNYIIVEKADKPWSLSAFCIKNFFICLFLHKMAIIFCEG